jgi:hypothetical protein
LNAWTIPNHPNYFLGADSGSVCDTLTGVKKILVENSRLEIYPNPIIGEELTFTYNISSEKGTLIIYNEEGQQVAQYTIPQWSSNQHLKLPKLASGIYMARLKQGNAISSVKFIKE